MPAACHNSLAWDSDLWSVVRACWWPAPVTGVQRQPACHVGIQLVVAGTRQQTAITGLCWRLTTCCWSALKASHLLVAYAGSLPPVAGTCRRTAACRQHVLQDCRLAPASASHLLTVLGVRGGLPSVSGTCQRPTACHWRAPLDCHMSPVHAGCQSSAAGA